MRWLMRESKLFALYLYHLDQKKKAWYDESGENGVDTSKNKYESRSFLERNEPNLQAIIALSIRQHYPDHLPCSKPFSLSCPFLSIMSEWHCNPLSCPTPIIMRYL